MECDFCGNEIPQGKGKMLVLNSGKTFRFCSSKCENNYELGRRPRDVEWTDEHRRLQEGEED